MLIVKMFGIALVISASTLIGFLKSRQLVSRFKKLLLLCEGADMLYEYVEQEGCELQDAIKSAFDKCDFLCFEQGNFVCCDDDLTDEDKNETEEFFSLLGTGGKKTECDRIANFKLKMKRFCDDAEKDALQKCKIYRTFGICIGLTVGILLI